ncbi:MAG: TAT-variant-translocated molybdopterin oxidoreductase [Bdellovibrionota bacterium]
MKETQYWRSFEQKENSETYQQFLQKEFPAGAEEMSNPVTRRNFMKIMGSSAALAGLTACRMPKESIVPYVKSPEKLVPGKPKYYATSMSIGRHVQGLLVENHEGRPTHIQGNDRHPSSMGAIGELEQASILSMYDPERLKVVSHQGVPKSWNQFETYWRELTPQLASNAGASLAVISNESTSITIDRLKKDFLQQYPKATWASYESIHQDNIQQGLGLIGHDDVLPYYRFEQADVILSIGHDFLGSDLDAVRHTRGFAKKRRVRSTKDHMNRLYTVESAFTITGSNADHRIKLNPSEIEGFVLAIYQALSKHISLPVITGENMTTIIKTGLKHWPKILLITKEHLWFRQVLLKRQQPMRWCI